MCDLFLDVVRGGKNNNKNFTPGKCDRYNHRKYKLHPGKLFLYLRDTHCNCVNSTRSIARSLFVFCVFVTLFSSRDTVTQLENRVSDTSSPTDCFAIRGQQNHGVSLSIIVSSIRIITFTSNGIIFDGSPRVFRFRNYG